MASAASPPPASVVPAQLGFLAIFNPSLSADDETLDDQIVYYASVTARAAGPRRRHRPSRGKPTAGLSPEERNERLRQIGLAQGMVDFSRGFANGKPVDTIETEKSRVVLKELEPGWWVLASIDLTKLPLPPRLGAASNSNGDGSENVEYSSRELKTGPLLLQDLLRAHSVFLLHHAASLSALFVRTQRSKFTAMLGRYWDIFLSTWNVMLHGNPACSVFGGIKVAASGELGVGVGEEDRGSGEREVLEGFVGRVEGLVDLVVSKFGEPGPGTTGGQQQEAATGGPSTTAWLGTGDEPGAEDGAIFLGVGALSRHSLRDMFYWMEDMYTWGPAAYGVEESPTSTRIRTKRKRPRFNTVGNGTKSELPESTNGAAAQQPDGRGPTPASQPMTLADSNEGSDRSGMDRFVSYLKMGYGTHWSLGSSSEKAPQPAKADGAPTQGEPAPARESTTEPAAEPEAAPQPNLTDDTAGRFLIGLRGDVDDPGSDSLDSEDSGGQMRTLLRTLTVELESEAQNKPEAETTRDFGSGDHELRLTKSGRHKDSADPSSAFDSQDRNKTKRMRVVVYVSRPFIYTFLFENRTPSLAWESLYRSLHHQLAPLRKTLSVSTQYRPGRPDVGPVSSHIFDLVWDPRHKTVQSTIPNIPDPTAIYGQGLLGSQPQQPLWSRIEAINTHMQILNMYAATRTNCEDLERTCKTRRGWWVVWTRLLETRGLSLVNESEPGSTPALPSEDSKDSSNSEDTNRSASIDSSGTSDQVVQSQNASDETSSSQHVTEDSNETPTQETQRLQPQPPSDRRKRRKPKADKEIFLIRRAGEHSSARSAGGSLAEHGGGGWLDSSSRLAQGIGVDTRKYIEELLSLGR